MHLPLKWISIQNILCEGPIALVEHIAYLNIYTYKYIYMCVRALALVYVRA
jgi:hypothetical protein